MDYRRHGLTGSMKRRVFDALLQRQNGKCFICGFKAELNLYPNNPEWPRNTNICYLLYIDHCHTTGMIRGLLCQDCNTLLGIVENYGVGVEDDYKPSNIEEWENYDQMIEGAREWLDRYRTFIFLYMQRERWFPRKDILFHLQTRTNITP